MKSKILKRITIIIGIVIHLFLVGGVVTGIAIGFALDGGFSAHYDKQDLIENYEQKQTQIHQAKDYFVSILPPQAEVTIEFDGAEELEIFHVTKDGISSQNWECKTTSAKVDSLLGELGWDQQTLHTLKAKLDQANCIGLASGEPVKVDFQRSGSGGYSYNLFRSPMNDSLKTAYNDGCRYCFYHDQIVLEYGGGVLGQQCFEDYQRK